MPVRGALGALGAALAIAVAVAGCAGDGSPASGGAGEDKHLWSDKVCGSFVPVLDIASRAPSAATLSDPVAAAPALNGYLREVLGVVDQAVTGLDGAGRSPFSGGDEVVSMARASLVQVRTTVVKITATLDSAPPGVPLPGATATITGLARSVVDLLKLQNPAVRMSAAGEELRNEVQNAPRCKAIKDRTSISIPVLPTLGGQIPRLTLPPPLVTPIPRS